MNIVLFLGRAQKGSYNLNTYKATYLRQKIQCCCYVGTNCGVPADHAFDQRKLELAVYFILPFYLLYIRPWSFNILQSVLFSRNFLDGNKTLSNTMQRRSEAQSNIIQH